MQNEKLMEWLRPVQDPEMFISIVDLGLVYEADFKLKTEVCDRSKEIKNIFSLFDGAVRRSHIIKLEPGGHFPPHRDGILPEAKCLRLFSPLWGSSNDAFYFILNKKKIEFEIGRLYFVNTRLEHSVFSFGTSYQLVMNVEINQETVATIANMTLQSFQSEI